MRWSCIGRGSGARAGFSCELYEQLGLDQFWERRLRRSREGTNWCDILQTLVCYRLIDPGSEWRLHRQWFEQSAMGGLAGRGFHAGGEECSLRCLDKLLPHQQALFSHLRQRWAICSAPSSSVALRPDQHLFRIRAPGTTTTTSAASATAVTNAAICVQVSSHWIVTPDGFPARL